MTTTVAESAFLDTNVVLHAVHEDSPYRVPCRAALESLRAENVVLCVSGQVIREMLVNLTHPRSFARPKSPREAVSLARLLLEQVDYLDEGQSDVVEKTLALAAQFDVAGKQIHDCSIVATMLVHGVPRLITRNARDFSRFRDQIRIDEIG